MDDYLRATLGRQGSSALWSRICTLRGVVISLPKPLRPPHRMAALVPAYLIGVPPFHGEGQRGEERRAAAGVMAGASPPIIGGNAAVGSRCGCCTETVPKCPLPVNGSGTLTHEETIPKQQ